MAKRHKPGPKVGEGRMEEVREQLKDLMPLVERGDPELSRWETDFLDQMHRLQKRDSLTSEQADKVNQIYEQKYLRGVYSGRRR